MKIRKIDREDYRLIIDLTEKEAKHLAIVAKRFCLLLRPEDSFFQEEDFAKSLAEKLDALQNPKT